MTAGGTTTHTTHVWVPFGNVCIMANTGISSRNRTKLKHRAAHVAMGLEGGKFRLTCPACLYCNSLFRLWQQSSFGSYRQRCLLFQSLLVIILLTHFIMWRFLFTSKERTVISPFCVAFSIFSLHLHCALWVHSLNQTPCLGDTKSIKWAHCLQLHL